MRNNIDVMRLIDHLRSGFPYNPYHGDVMRDVIDVLEDYAQAVSEAENLKSRIEEAKSCLPDEDKLDPVLDALMSARDAKNKSDKQEFILEGLEALHTVITEMTGETEYALELLNGKG